MRRRRLLCGLLAASMLTAQAAAADFSDTADHWAGAAIDRWSACGIVEGYDDGRFGPGDPLTRAQMAAILDRLFGWTEQGENTFPDLRGDEWYAGAVLRAGAAGVLYGDNAGNARPNDPVTRQEAAVMLDRALALAAEGAGRTFHDEADIGAWARGAVETMSALGVIKGDSAGNFAPLRPITRAEAAALLDRSVAGYYDRAGVYRENRSGAVTIVAAPGVTLQDLEIAGSLIIAPAAAGSETILRNVTVTGDTRVLAGRDAPVLLLGNSRLERVEMAGEDGRLEAEPTVEIGALTVSGSGTHLRGLDAEQQVTVAAGAQNVLVNGHPVQPGAAAAGEDVSTDADDVEVEPEPENRPSGGGGGGASGEPDRPAESPGPQPGGGSRDEEGNIIIDFDDLLGGNS